MSQPNEMRTSKKKRVDLAIIIVNWNTKDLLKKCIQSICGATERFDHEIWIVDNGSTDGSVEMLRKQLPLVNLVTNENNLGFAKASNIGIRSSNGKYVCLVNTDVEIMPGCLDHLREYMERNPKTGMVGPRILNPDKTLQVSCYSSPTFWNSFCYGLGLDRMFPRTNLLGSMYNKYRPYDKTRPVDVISGCFCLVRREALEDVGLLDERFFMYMEDFDWCKRFQLAGWDVIYTPEVEAIHYGGGSSPRDSEKYWIERTRAMAYYWRKYHGWIGKLYIQGVIFTRHILRLVQGLAWYLLKPSERRDVSSKIGESIAGMHLILHARASK